jgi:hypothetical protein
VFSVNDGKVKMQSLIDDPTRASRYLADQLTEAECAEYEARIASDPETVAEIEATARLKIGLDRLRRSGELSELMTATTASPQGQTWMLAMAATLAAVVIGAGLWFPRFHSTGTPLLAAALGSFKDPSGRSLAVVSTTPLFRTRAERYDAVIDLPGTRGAIRLRVLPSNPTPSAHYQAALARVRDDDSSETAVTVRDLQPSSEDGFVDVYADSSLLVPGRYRLILTREAANSAAGSGESDTFVVKVNTHH